MRDPRAYGDHRCSTGSQSSAIAAQPAPRLPHPHWASALMAPSCYYAKPFNSFDCGRLELHPVDRSAISNSVGSACPPAWSSASLAAPAGGGRPSQLVPNHRLAPAELSSYSSAMDQSSASVLVPHHPQPGLFAQAANLEATRGVSRRQQGTAPGPERSSGLRSHRGNTAEWCDLASGTSCGQ
jgi:hypothetical protein